MHIAMIIITNGYSGSVEAYRFVASEASEWASLRSPNGLHS